MWRYIVMATYAVQSHIGGISLAEFIRIQLGRRTSCPWFNVP